MDRRWFVAAAEVSWPVGCAAPWFGWVVPGRMRPEVLWLVRPAQIGWWVFRALDRRTRAGTAPGSTEPDAGEVTP
ncbi:MULTISPECIES: hypothetical protein [Catenuloplanes]|uniref:Uncharacterized protein n=1 Tax=Catenuloplanes niger TaxID=587534 RepID=A0AAE3ZLS9_9ACTN|nr:hypothetical protein [Catenuloplanes niger]MDR7320220.1 hypothetical protein [Catenuloplanes niger]